MSQLKEILETEGERATLQQCAALHLFREGSFYRAYEWSAWLMVHFFPDMKVTHRILKGGEDIVFVGFPLTSLERYTPEGAAVSPSGDREVAMAMPGGVFPPDTGVESLQTDYANWKQAQPLTEASKKREEETKTRAERNAHSRLTDIMLRILAYPVEQHSPMECMAFLSEMKQQISEIL